MNDFIAMDISSAGIAAQRTRLRVIAENLANQHTTGPNGPYQRQETIFESVAFVDQLQFQLGSLEEVLTPEEMNAIHSVSVSSVGPDNSQPIMQYDPNHPLANAEGFVAYPNINIMREMADMMEATRSYEANLASMKTTGDMIRAAMELLS